MKWGGSLKGCSYILSSSVYIYIYIYIYIYKDIKLNKVKCYFIIIMTLCKSQVDFINSM